MLVMPLAQSAKCFLAIHQFTAFGLRKAMLNFRGNIGAIICQPSLVFMQHLNRLGELTAKRRRVNLRRQAAPASLYLGLLAHKVAAK
jgi:hypothetical protein